ncbi:response regulator transcription factor [Streptomyces sp. AK04-3B]|uniref:response regulator transcription factor n=1 Tax=Streptomyces sp. AK04-3B TaxID=3028650 RepID=UPI0029B69349|nr:response regulator transcription factor [Streptomyces sp. AK04-3B]MDX3802367.1 response regulator transcription factor [Streptomyces sp. AK04-3B]
MQVLLIEDDPDVANCLIRGLTRYGCDVTWETTGRGGLAAAAPDVVLLDLGLPDLDGLDVCRELRARSDVSLIVISGRGSVTDRIVGLELGADDYLVKPFLVRELVARMRAVRRRNRGAVPVGTPAQLPSVRSIGSPPDRHGTWPARDVYDRVAIDRRAHRVFLDGAEVALSPKEYALLEYLTSRAGALVTRESIMSAVWDSNWFGSTKTLDTHVTSLRNKLGAALCVEAVRGVGFRLVVGAAAAPVHPSAV